MGSLMWWWLRRGLWVAATLSWLALFGTAHAQGQTAPRIVRVEVDSVVSDEEALRASLRELLSRVNVRLVEIDVAEELLLADVVITGNEQGATVRVFPKQADAPATIHRVPRAESEALFRETLAHVVLGAVEPLLSASPPPPPPPPPEEPPAPPLPRAWELGAGVGALHVGDQRWAAQLSALGHLQLGTRVPSLFGVALGAALPSEQERADVQSRLWMLSIRARAGVEPFVGDHVRVALVASAGGDLFTVRAASERAAGSHKSPRHKIDPVMGIAAELRVNVTTSLCSLLSVGSDFDFTPHDFVAEEGRRERLLWRAGPVRPHALVGLTWSTR